MKYTNYFSLSVKSVALTLAAFAALVSSAVTIPNTPLVTQVTAKPMVMLVAGKDHKLFYEAYNDAGDIDGDGVHRRALQARHHLLTACLIRRSATRTTTKVTTRDCSPRIPLRCPVPGH